MQIGKIGIFYLFAFCCGLFKKRMRDVIFVSGKLGKALKVPQSWKMQKRYAEFGRRRLFFQKTRKTFGVGVF